VRSLQCMSDPNRDTNQSLVLAFAEDLAKGYCCSRVLELSDLNGAGAAPLGDATGSLVICAERLEQREDTGRALGAILRLLEEAPIGIVTARDRDRGVGKWNPTEFRAVLQNAGLEVLFHGRTTGAGGTGEKDTILSVVRRPRKVVAPPPEFRVVGLVAAYNEEDIIESFLRHTIGQGIEVILIDNWSTDRTAERASAFVGRGLTGIIKFPETGPTPTYEWHSILKRKEELAQELDADWFVHLDVDELRESPWPELTVREALHRVGIEGFNAVNHTCLVFHPTVAPYRDDMPLDFQLTHFEFGTRPGHFAQIKAWSRQGSAIQLADSGGHDARFAGRRVYPFRFLLRHYPIRSQRHGERKVLIERLGRYSPADRERGWHTHYDGIQAGHSFTRDPETLLSFSGETFYEEYLIERLTGVRAR